MLHIHPNSANTTVRFLSRGIFVKRVWPTISFSVHALRSLLLSIGCLFLLICIQLRYDYKMRPNNGIIHIENRSSHTRKRFVCWTVQRLKSTFDRTVIFKFIASGSAKNIMILWLMWCWGGGCCLFGSLTFFSLFTLMHTDTKPYFCDGCFDVFTIIFIMKPLNFNRLLATTTSNNWFA